MTTSVALACRKSLHGELNWDMALLSKSILQTCTGHLLCVLRGTFGAAHRQLPGWQTDFSSPQESSGQMHTHITGTWLHR